MPPLWLFRQRKIHLSYIHAWLVFLASCVVLTTSAGAVTATLVACSWQGLRMIVLQVSIHKRKPA